MNILKIAMATVLGASIVVGAVSAQVFNATPRGKVSQAKAAAPATYQPRTMRGQATSTIVRNWVGYVRSVYGTSPSVWVTAMQDTFATADVHNMQLAAKMTTFEGMMSALMGQRASDDQIIDKLARTESSMAVMALGSPSEDLVFTAVVPCRLFDTRLAVGAIGAGETRHFSTSGTGFAAQGGAASDCGIPANASAVVMNMVTVNPASGGYLTVFPFNSARPLAASVNFVVDQATANELIVKQTMGQEFDFSVYAFSQAHVVADVAGYFMAPVATKLDCYRTVMTGTSVAPNTKGSAGAVCQLNYTAVGGFAQWCSGLNEGPIQSGPFDDTFLVYAFNTTNSTQNACVTAKCCRLPGR